jgi:excisionase family DNA binding protein
MSIELEPIAIPPGAAARYIGVSKRHLYRLLATGAVTARKDGRRTLVDVASLKTYYDSLPEHASGDPLFPTH